MQAAHAIIGHERQRKELETDLERGALSHAYLFSGKKHLGKFTIAHWFAQEILTQGMMENEREKTQTLIRKNMHPDLLTLDRLWVEDVCTDWNVIAKSSSVSQHHRAKAKVKTDTIGIDDVRVLQERLYETPQGSHTVCLIRSIERLHVTAANAFLKILEEPPPHVLFCFTTESLSSLPATIISRMRVIHFSSVPRKELEPLVSPLPADDRELLLSIAEGAPGIILRCLEDSERLRAERQAQIDAHRFLQTASVLERFRKMQEMLESEKDQASMFLRQLFLHLQSDLRGSEKDAENALEQSRSLLHLLALLQTNANRPLIAAHAAFSS